MSFVSTVIAQREGDIDSLMVAELSVDAQLIRGVDLDMVTVANVTALGGKNVDIDAQLNATAAIGAELTQLVLLDQLTYIIPRETRVYTVRRERRSYTIAQENRVHKIRG
jgi:hypothetical protein